MLEQVRADHTRERDELRAAMEARTQAIEDARNDLRARAERAEADTLRRELAERRSTAEASSDDAQAAAGKTTPRRTRRSGTAST